MKIGEEMTRDNFLTTVSTLSRERIITCYQCGKCTAGCPMAEDMDLMPNQVMRYIQLNLKEALFQRKAFWLCVSCEACTTRCPKGIDIARVMDTLRIMALVEGYKPADRLVAVFNRLFLDQVRKHGRLNELPLAGLFNVASFRPLKDALLVPALYKRGKLSLETQKVRDINPIEKIFAQARKFGQGPGSPKDQGHD